MKIRAGSKGAGSTSSAVSVWEDVVQKAHILKSD